jgi:hypothetical protein
MTATMTESTTTTYTMKVVQIDGGRYAVSLTTPTSTDFLRDFYGSVRTFSTPNSARKAITRANRPSGDRHR